MELWTNLDTKMCVVESHHKDTSGSAELENSAKCSHSELKYQGFTLAARATTSYVYWRHAVFPLWFAYV